MSVTITTRATILRSNHNTAGTTAVFLVGDNIVEPDSITETIALNHDNLLLAIGESPNLSKWYAEAT